MPRKANAIPISDSAFGKKSAAHHGTKAAQLKNDGVPVAKYPYIQSVVPAKETAHPATTSFFISDVTFFCSSGVKKDADANEFHHRARKHR
jgi:hypothetical protein